MSTTRQDEVVRYAEDCVSDRALLETAISLIKWILSIVAVLVTVIVSLGSFIYSNDRAEVRAHGILLQEMVTKTALYQSERNIVDEMRTLKKDLKGDIHELKADIRELRSGRKDSDAKKGK